VGNSDPLRRLHEDYVWEVNAAVADGRMDLVWRLADEYTDEALRLMTSLQSPGCGRPSCAICTGSGSARDLPARSLPARRKRFWRRHPGAA
jgi:hypothetical protein